MNVTSIVTYKIIRYILLSEGFSQTAIHNKTGCSLGQINKVVNWLITRNFVEKSNHTYQMVDPAGIIALFPLFRTMKELLVFSIPIREEKQKIIKNLPQESVLCLDSALDIYSRYFRSSRICVYHRKPDIIKKMFKPYSGGMLHLEVYHPDMNLKDDVVDGVTFKLRTVIDMACDGKTYAAKDVLEQLWGIRFE